MTRIASGDVRRDGKADRVFLGLCLWILAALALVAGSLLPASAQMDRPQPDGDGSGGPDVFVSRPQQALAGQDSASPFLADMVSGTGAQETDPVSAVHKTDQVEAILLSEWESVPAQGGSFRVALRQKIIEGWHTYWRNPGDSGEPTQIVWDLPEGVEAGDIAWPAPSRLPYGPLVNFGYEKDVVFTVPVTVAPGLEAGSVVRLRAKVYWLVCADICIPQDGEVELVLPVVPGNAEIDQDAQTLIEETTRSLPGPSPWPARYALDGEQVTFGLDAPGLAEGFGPGLIESAAFFPYQDGIIVNADDQVLRHGAGGFTVSTGAGFRLTNRPDALPETVEGVLVLHDRSSGELVLRSVLVEAQAGSIPETWGAVAAPGIAGVGGAGGNGPADLPPFHVLLGFALLGGLILNLMPCVFPVLFMKAFGFVAAAREAPWIVRAHGMAFTAGVILSFLALAGLLIGLRAGGEQIGWGFQLQSPVVVALLFYLMMAIGLNLSGVFDVGRSVMGLGGGLGAQPGLSGAFFTGVLATVVASPCTAPFMGLAIGTALTLPTIEALAIFAALGLGMALPWLILSFLPGLLALLPRPGPWMDLVRHMLAWPMYATAGWLLWVLTQQLGPDGLAMVLAGAFLVALAAWIFGRTQDPLTGETGASHAAGRLLAAVVLTGGLALAGGLAAVPGLTGGAPSGESADGGSAAVDTSGVPLRAVAYDEARLARVRDEGRPVFVYFTAAWCITCKVNENTVFRSQKILDRFEATNVLVMRGDWTNRDPVITAALERFGRPGVPLYVFYGPSSESEPMILPQFLTESIMLDLVADL